MRVFGLTGSLGSGKSTAASMFARCGARIVDSDRIAHGLIAASGNCYRPVVRAFGREILTNGRIDRKKLGRSVFNDRKALLRLERIVHPAVRKEIIKEVKKNKRKIIIVDVPLLFESGFDRMMDCTIVVKAGRKKQIERARRKLKVTRAEVLKRINRQWPQSEKIRRADFIINNNGTIQQLNQQVRKIWQKIQPKTKN